MKSTPYYYVNVLNVLSPNLLGGYIVDEIVEDKLLLDMLPKALSELTEDERFLIGEMLSRNVKSLKKSVYQKLAFTSRKKKFCPS